MMTPQQIESTAQPADARLLCGSGRMLLDQRRWAEAGEAGRRAVEIIDAECERMDRRDADVILLEGLAIWGTALRQLGHTREAEASLRRALVIAGAYPREPWRIAAACNDLGTLSQTVGNFLEAEQLYRRALAIVEGSGRRGGEMAATVYRSLASLEHARGNYERGLTPARKACQIRTKLAGPDHPDTIADRVVLASLYDGLRRYAESRPIYLHALAVLERIEGPEHYDLAVCLDRLAAIEYADGRQAEAIGLYRRALAVMQNLLGPLHAETIRMARNLMRAEQDCGSTSRAQRSIGRALQKVIACYDCYEGKEDCCRS